MLEISTIFSIDIAAYAILNNHYHVVLHIDQDRANKWSIREVCTRWHELFAGNDLSRRFIKDEVISSDEEIRLTEITEEWRKRLYSLEWFMRCLNEPIARDANQEDQVTGRFWEGRYKSQALLDEKALAACLAYVDLNPIRAKMADTPEASDHTSIKQRIDHQQQTEPQNPELIASQPRALLPFAGYPRQNMPKGLPFRYTDYLELVDSFVSSVRLTLRAA